jgi:hypothetical protein
VERVVLLDQTTKRKPAPGVGHGLGGAAQLHFLLEEAVSRGSILG